MTRVALARRRAQRRLADTIRSAGHLADDVPREDLVAELNRFGRGFDELAHDYRAERERIEQTYGSSSAEAGAHRDQALAALYHRSGWTQDELAKVEGCKPTMVLYRLRFGRFLAFLTTGEKPRNLTEHRFRSYWEQTEKDPNERVRFAAVLRRLHAAQDAAAAAMA